MPVIIHDLFPAQVYVTPRDTDSGELLPDHTFEINAARVVVTDTEVLVAIDSPSGPLLALTLPYSPGHFDKAAGTVHTDTGQFLSFRKDESCGCGSRLRGWNPYASIVAKRA